MSEAISEQLPTPYIKQCLIIVTSFRILRSRLKQESRWAYRLRIGIYLIYSSSGVKSLLTLFRVAKWNSRVNLDTFALRSSVTLCIFSSQFLQSTACQRRRAIFTALHHARLAWWACKGYSQTSTWRRRPIFQINYIRLARRTYVREFIHYPCFWKQSSLSPSPLSRHRWCRFRDLHGLSGLIQSKWCRTNWLIFFPLWDAEPLQRQGAHWERLPRTRRDDWMEAPVGDQNRIFAKFPILCLWNWWILTRLLSLTDMCIEIVKDRGAGSRVLAEMRHLAGSCEMWQCSRALNFILLSRSKLSTYPRVVPRCLFSL